MDAENLKSHHLIDQLRSWDWRAVLPQLRAAGSSLRVAAAEGLTDLDWRVRAGCAEYMDHFADDRCIERLILVLHDPKRVVRQLATHAVGCHHCKSAAISVDVVAPLIRRLDEDPSLKVRRHAAHMLLFQPPQRRITKRLHRLLREEEDPNLLRKAKTVLAYHERGFYAAGAAIVRARPDTGAAGKAGATS
jgi:HEAT repeat protein